MRQPTNLSALTEAADSLVAALGDRRQICQPSNRFVLKIELRQEFWSQSADKFVGCLGTSRQICWLPPGQLGLKNWPIGLHSNWLGSTKISIKGGTVLHQGDQIGWIFTHCWAIVVFGQFLGIYRSSPMFWCHFATVKVIINFGRKLDGLHFGRPTHLVTLD
jgi:hypothetical protein